MYAIPAESLTEFTNAIQGIQNQMALLNFQMTNMAQRLTAIDGRDLPTAAHLPQLPQPGFATLPASSAPVLPDATSAYTAAPSAPMATTAAPRAPPTLAGQFGVPITQICFPPSPSPLPSFESVMGDMPMASAPAVSAPARMSVPLPMEGAQDGHVVPKYHKLMFPTYDGKEDPLGWLNKCEQFFNGHQTRHQDRVWLASYHLTGVAQQWYLVLESDAGRPIWDDFRTLCQQRFGPPLSTNHLSDLARLPFTSTVDAYMEAFQARAAHAGRLSPGQKAKLFTGGLPEHIRVNVELHDP